KQVTLAEALTSDGQKLLAFNDLFIGARTHISARYRIEFRGRSENQSSSGLIVSTVAGSTGWMSSIFNMTRLISEYCGGSAVPPSALPREERRLIFTVREPFISKHSSASIGIGLIDEGQ